MNQHPGRDGGEAGGEHEDAAATLGRDAMTYRRFLGPLVTDWGKLEADVLGPPPRIPRHPLALARFGLLPVRSAHGLADSWLHTKRARGLFAGLAAPSMLPLEAPLTASFGLVLGVLGHAAGWPVARGGSQRIADALVSYLRSLGGEVVA